MHDSQRDQRNHGPTNSHATTRSISTENGPIPDPVVSQRSKQLIPLDQLATEFSRLANHTGLQSPRSDSADRSSIAESARKWRESHSHLFTVNADGSPYVAPGSTLRNEQIEFLRRKKLGPKVAFIDAPDLNESIPDMG